MDLTEVRQNYTRLGFRDATHLYSYQALKRVLSFSRWHGMTLTMADIDPSYLRLPDGYEARFLDRLEIMSFGVDPANELPSDFLSQALDNGDLCYAIVQSNRLASYGWYANNPTPIDHSSTLEFGDGWIYMYKGFTHRDFRGQRLHAIGMARALDELTKQGNKGLVSIVEANNHASLRSAGSATW